MAERDLRQRVIQVLRPFDACSVENSARRGTPDVNCVLGWLELKWLRRWPKDTQSRLMRLEHRLSRQQAVWLRRRWKAGGGAWALLQVRSEYFLFDGVRAELLAESFYAKQLYEECLTVLSSLENLPQALLDSRPQPILTRWR